MQGVFIAKKYVFLELAFVVRMEQEKLLPGQWHKKAFAALYELKAMNNGDQQGIFESTYHLNITTTFLSIS